MSLTLPKLRSIVAAAAVAVALIGGAFIFDEVLSYILSTSLVAQCLLALGALGFGTVMAYTTLKEKKD